MNSATLRAMILALSLFFHSEVYGSGFAVFTHDAASLGQGNAAIAHTEGPSSVYFNPALINRLEGTQLQLGTTLISPSRQFDSDFSGSSADTEHQIFFPSTFFVTHKFNDHAGAGFGIFSPFGLGTDWDDKWEGRYITTGSQIKTFNFNPAFSLRVMPNVFVGAGLNYLVMDAELEKNINLSGLGLSDAGQSFSGDGDGIGFNVGTIFDISENLTIGASYRSEIKVGIDGKTTFSLPQNAPPVIAGLFPNSGAETNITLPQQAFLGIHFKGLDPLTFETGLRWEGWSSFDELAVAFDKTIAGSQSSVTEKDWHDVYSADIGAEYRMSDTIVIRAGYIYSGNPIPDSTFEPSIPDSQTHVFSMGTGITFGNFKLDIAYAYQNLETRTKNNTVDDNASDGIFNESASANGTYDSSLHLIGTGLTYRF